jgi:F-type H+-transporting ATPase subunit c
MDGQALELAKQGIGLAHLAAGFGAGIVVLGAGIGIGNIAKAAMEGTARQPEAANEIRTSMLISAALIEGVALFGEVICVLLAIKTVAGY